MNLEDLKTWQLPVKYTLLPIYKQTGYDDFGRYYDIDAFIVSKCFVQEKREKIVYDGNHEISYIVLFPFTMNNYLKVEDGCQKFEATVIFDDYKEAKDYAKEINDALFIKNLSVKDATSNFSSCLGKREEQYKKLDDVEDYIMEYTKDLVIEPINWGKKVLQKKLLKDLC